MLLPLLEFSLLWQWPIMNWCFCSFLCALTPSWGKVGDSNLSPRSFPNSKQKERLKGRGWRERLKPKSERYFFKKKNYMCQRCVKKDQTTSGIIGVKKFLLPSFMPSKWANLCLFDCLILMINFVPILTWTESWNSHSWWVLRNDCAVLCITSYLGFNEFSRFALVNKLAVRLSTFEPLWERHCQREFGCRRTEIEPRPSSSRELFKFLFEKMGMMYKNSREASFSQMVRARGKVTLA